MNGTRSIVGYFAVVCLGWIAPCYAAEPLAGLLACRTLSDAAARLACFDRETAALEAKVAAPAAAAAPRPVPRLDPTGQFGLPEHTVAKQEVAAGTRAKPTFCSWRKRLTGVPSSRLIMPKFGASWLPT